MMASREIKFGGQDSRKPRKSHLLVVFSSTEKQSLYKQILSCFLMHLDHLEKIGAFAHQKPVKMMFVLSFYAYIGPF